MHGKWRGTVNGGARYLNFNGILEIRGKESRPGKQRGTVNIGTVNGGLTIYIYIYIYIYIHIFIYFKSGVSI